MSIHAIYGIIQYTIYSIWINRNIKGVSHTAFTLTWTNMRRISPMLHTHDITQLCDVLKDKPGEIYSCNIFFKVTNCSTSM